MRTIFAIMKKELKAYYISPVAYTVIAVFLFIMGFYFFALIQRFTELSWAIKAQQYQFGMEQLNINQEVVRPFFSIMLTISLFIMPILTMRLFSEEIELGTIELLLTSPVTEMQLIAGKFLASLVFYLSILVLSVPHILILFGVTDPNPDVGPILTSYLGLFLVGCTFLGIGMFLSSLTGSQLVAGVLSFGVLLLLGIVSWASNFSDPALGKVLTYISIFEHFEDFSKGIFDTQHLVYYITFSFFAFFLTYASLDSLKWRA